MNQIKEQLREALTYEPIRAVTALALAVLGTLVLAGVAVPAWAVVIGGVLSAEMGRHRTTSVVRTNEHITNAYHVGHGEGVKRGVEAARSFLVDDDEEDEL